VRASAIGALNNGIGERMMNKKTLLTIILAVCMAFGTFGAVGCNKANGNSSGGTDISGDEKKDDNVGTDKTTGDNAGDNGDSTGNNTEDKTGDNTGTDDQPDDNAGTDTSNVAVTGVSLSQSAVSLKVGEKAELTATVSPSNATNTEVKWSTSNSAVATVSNGMVVAEAVGTAIITVTTIDGAKTATCTVTVTAASASTVSLSYVYAGNESAAFEWADGNPSGATIKYKKDGETSYTTLDSELIRSASASGYARADVVGLKGGATYEFIITTSSGEEITTQQAIAAYDRSGYAHFNYSSGVGAYNDDGTLKNGATVVYVTEATKNTVTAKIGGKTYTGIVKILQNAGTTTPLVVRVIGTVGAATWKENKVTYNVSTMGTDGEMTPDNIIANTTDLTGSGATLSTQNYSQDDLVGIFNELDTSVYPVLNGLTSKMKYDSSKNEFDSYWNMCDISGVSNVTIEGIGEDARIFQWGFTWKNCTSIEVRNLTFEDYTEDACSFEGSKSEDSSATPSDFSSKYYWVHHNTFEEGVNYWDVCSEQDKHDGDGTTDFKYCAFITLSYNTYNYTHKTGLIGGGNSQHTASVTFHHNYYYNCKARLPLARQANMHMYNNYYCGTTSCDISLRANAYALVENCYFESSNNRPVELQYDSNTGYGAAKLINCVVTQSKISTAKNVPSSALYIGNDRTATVTNGNTYGTTFDTDSSLFYYDSANKCSKVTIMLTAEQTKAQVPLLAGVQKRGGTV